MHQFLRRAACRVPREEEVEARNSNHIHHYLLLIILNKHM